MSRLHVGVRDRVQASTGAALAAALLLTACGGADPAAPAGAAPSGAPAASAPASAPPPAAAASTPGADPTPAVLAPKLAITGTSFYVDAGSGADGNDGRSEGTAWRTIERVRTAQAAGTLQPGDGVFFRRGQTFDGPLAITRAGAAGQPVTFSAYGSGTMPVFNGLATVTGWTARGNGVWEAPCGACAEGLNLVTLNGVPQAMGRFPNASEPNRGYLSYEAHSWTDVTYWSSPPQTITDEQLGASPDWTGAELVIRKNSWDIDRGAIVAHAGKRLTYVNATAQEPTDGFGYFIQNDPRTLDQPGEWYFDPAAKKLLMFFGAAGPAGQDVRASVVQRLVLLDGTAHVTIEGLGFQGANRVAVEIRNGSHDLLLQNCSIVFSGSDAIVGSDSDRLVLDRLTIAHSLSNAISLEPTTGSVVRDSVVRDTAMLPGMGKSNNGGYVAVYLSGPNNTIEYNRIENTGYVPIAFLGDHALVKNNLVDTYTTVKDDGGGISNWGDSDKIDKRIIGNIVLNGIGAPAGTNSPYVLGSNGIYLDTDAANVLISGNTLVNNSRTGIFLHNAHEVTIEGNTLFDNPSLLAMIHDETGPPYPIRNVRSSRNIMVAKSERQRIIEAGSLVDDIQRYGAFDDNRYASPYNENGIISAGYANGAGGTTSELFDLAAWTAKYGFDAHSAGGPVRLASHLVTATVGTNLYPGGRFDGGIDGVFCLGTGCQASWRSSSALDGGALQVTHDPSAAAASTGVYLSLGPVVAGRTYRVRFSLVSAGATRIGQTALLRNGGDYGPLSGWRALKLSGQRGETEFVFAAPTSEAATLLTVAFGAHDFPFWIDNVEVIEVNATPLSADEAIRFEYNATKFARTIALPGKYVDVDNTAYNGNITLQPFTSAVLFKR